MASEHSEECMEAVTDKARKIGALGEDQAREWGMDYLADTPELCTCSPDVRAWRNARHGRTD